MTAIYGIIFVVAVVLIALVIGKMLMASFSRKKERIRIGQLAPFGRERFRIIEETILKLVADSKDQFIQRDIKQSLNSVFLDLMKRAKVEKAICVNDAVTYLSTLPTHDFETLLSAVSSDIALLVRERREYAGENGANWHMARQFVKNIAEGTVTPRQGVSSMAKDENIIDLANWSLSRFSKHDVHRFYGAMHEYDDIEAGEIQVPGKSKSTLLEELDKEILQEAKFWLSVHERH